MAWLGRILEGNFSVSNRGPRGTASNMRGNYLIGFAAGIVTAVVFLSATTGSVPMRVLLFLLTPLPLFLAGFGWGWGTTVIAAIAGTLATAVLTTVQVATIFAISPAIPSIILTYLVTLNRPATGPGPDVDPNTRLEWYPVGRIVVWAAAISGVMALIAMVLIGPDLDTLRQEVKKLVETVFKAQFESINGGKALSDADLERLVDVGMYILPAATALSWMLTVLLNLWLAGRIALASGRLPRPWPDIPSMRFPRFTPLILAVASLATFIPGYVALGASAFSGVFYFAYVLMGLAVIHYITRGQPWRSFALWALYVVLLVLSTGISVLIALLGLVEGIVSIRGRAKSLPPPPRPPPDNSS